MDNTVQDYINDLEGTIKAEDLSLLYKPLLKWYRQNARILPWREEPTPYRVWVSEIMLQQTRIEAVLPYFQRFILRFPNIKALAYANEEALLKAWEGLGYYNRVRNMKKSAIIVMEKYGGELPSLHEELVKLPGIGEYTAGAIASIVFNRPVPAVDGNVLRVVARLFGTEQDITDAKVKRKMRNIVGVMQPESCPGDFTQAMMELGEVICSPGTAPKCTDCPLKKYCAGYLRGTAPSLPYKASKKPRRTEKRTLVFLISRDGVLLYKRPVTGLLPGLYEPLNLEGWINEEALAGRLCQTGMNVAGIQRGPDTKHIYSHVEWHMQAFFVYVQIQKTQPDAVVATESEVQGSYALVGACKSYKESLIKQLRQIKSPIYTNSP